MLREIRKYCNENYQIRGHLLELPFQGPYLAHHDSSTSDNLLKYKITKIMTSCNHCNILTARFKLAKQKTKSSKLKNLRFLEKRMKIEVSMAGETVYPVQGIQ